MRGMRIAAHSVSLLALQGTLGCAPTAADRIANKARVVETERTPDKLVARGLAFARMGDLTRAEQYLAAALDAGADSDTVLPTLIRVCVVANRYRVAIWYARTRLEAHPNDVRLRFVVAELQAALEDGPGARKDLERVLDVEPKNAAARFAYARLLRDRFGDVRAADKEFRAYLALEPNGEHAEEAGAAVLREVPAPVPAPDEGTAVPTPLAPTAPRN